MIDKIDIDAIMAGGLGTWLESKNQLREETKQKAFYQLGAGIIAAAIIAGIAIGMGWGMIAYFAAMVVGAGSIAWAARTKKKVTDELKEGMNGALAEAMGIRFYNNVYDEYEFDTAKTYDLLASYDDCYLEDCWEGEMGSSNFKLYECKLTEERGSGKNRRTVTTFKGIIMRLHFARDFHGTTLIQRDAKIRFTLFGDNKKRGGQKLERIKMVDPRFEDAFDVYGTDQVEARYLVHPEYCERLIDLEKQFQGSKLKALFHGGDIILTMHIKKNLFESGSLNPEHDRNLLAKTVAQFASLAKLVTVLQERAR